MIKIGVIGSSLGGLVSLQQTAKDKRIKVLVLASPVSFFPHTSRRKEFSPEGVKEWKEKGYTFTESGRFGKLKLNYSYYEDGLKYGDYSVYEKKLHSRYTVKVKISDKIDKGKVTFYYKSKEEFDQLMKLLKA